jgi:N4-gp56 family major capsid protein
MAFTTNLSGVTQVDDSVILAYDQAYIVAVGQDNVMDQFVTRKTQIGAKSIQLPKYARLAAATTPLAETDDVVSVALSDAPILLTPAEYGNVVTKTNLASLQTGGTIDLAAAQIVGLNHGLTMDKLALLAADGSTNSYVIGGTAEGSVASNQVASDVFLNYFYNKLARASVPMIDGSYIMVAHDDVIADLREATGTGSWVDVSKYSTPETVLKNEVGMYKGFRVVRDNNASFADQTGAGTVDLYNSYFFGFNALGKATSQEGRMVATGPFDKLNRFVNLGWYEVSAYGIIDQDALWLGKSASSKGANA